MDDVRWVFLASSLQVLTRVDQMCERSIDHIRSGRVVVVVSGDDTNFVVQKSPPFVVQPKA